ncbi:hypothetical protein O0L34_g7123 [Tuta absoluta]|nr:hypothetical protein O0L34_g7123 [Tuta absoluta]
MAFVYSCCFWFSLRLGGIIIGTFSLLQGLLVLIGNCVAYNRIPDVQEQITHLLDNFNLIYVGEYLEYMRNEPGKVITFGICSSCFYIFFCLLYIYGAYTYNNMLMIAFILSELVRLVGLSVMVATWLLVLKQNTMDIGLLIGASVGSGFFLLGMFYLWVCAANLPVLINEMECDEQAKTIARLRRLLQEGQKPVGRNLDAFPADRGLYNDVFMVSRKRNDLDRIEGTRTLLSVKTSTSLQNKQQILLF